MSLFTLLLSVTALIIVLALIYEHMGRQSPPPPPYHLIQCIRGLLFPDVHSGRSTPCPRITSDLRYPEVARPPNTANLHGEIENLDDGTEATHWYADVLGVTYHFVTAGDPASPAVLK
ncbi:MAG: hypothetical protein AAGL66_15795, partial [Pseudomonadota bacterium]